MKHRPRTTSATLSLLAVLALTPFVRASEFLEPPGTTPGYVALLLVNETPFPGERGWKSEADTKAAMLSILWVLHARVHHVPDGYAQRELAATEGQEIIDVITAGGVHGQCDGFYRDDTGAFVAVPRVHERAEYLTGIAGRGEPGRFARLLRFAQGLASAYESQGPDGADRYAELSEVRGVPVTGRAYSWMTDLNNYAPGGDFVRIPDEQDGAAGGNRFFTLRRRQ